MIPATAPPACSSRPDLEGRSGRASHLLAENTAHRPTGAGQQLDTTIGGNVDGEHALPGPAQGSRRRARQDAVRADVTADAGETVARENARPHRPAHVSRAPRPSGVDIAPDALDNNPLTIKIAVGAGARLDLRGGASRATCDPQVGHDATTAQIPARRILKGLSSAMPPDAPQSRNGSRSGRSDRRRHPP